MGNEASRGAGRRALKRIEDAQSEIQGMCFGLNDHELDICAEIDTLLNTAKLRTMKVIGFR